MKSPLDILFTLYPRRKRVIIRYQDDRVSRINGKFEVTREDKFDDLPPMYQKALFQHVKKCLTGEVSR